MRVYHSFAAARAVLLSNMGWCLFPGIGGALRFSWTEVPLDTPQREGRGLARRRTSRLNPTVGIPATEVRFGGWTVGPVVGRRPAGVAREAVQPSTGAHAVLVVVDARFTDRMPPDAAAVGRAGRLD